MLRVAFAVLAVLVFVGCETTPKTTQPESTKKEAPKGPSLYDRLGGSIAISCVCDKFLDVVVEDARLNANPKINDARQKVPRAHLKFQVTALVCEVTGGPQKYVGRNMKDSHAHLDITEAEWGYLVDDFVKVLDEFKVPEKEKNELLGIVGTTHDDIVMKK